VYLKNLIKSKCWFFMPKIFLLLKIQNLATENIKFRKYILTPFNVSLCPKNINFSYFTADISLLSQFSNNISTIFCKYWWNVFNLLHVINKWTISSFSLLHIKHTELSNLGFLNVEDIVKQFCSNHAHKNFNNACPSYLKNNSLKINEYSFKSF